jgi:retinol dehydrogenase-12
MGGGTSQARNTRFGEDTTAEDIGVAFGDRAKGMYIIVTGGSGGIGFETARVLVKYGAHVTVTCRTEKQGNDVVKRIKDEHGPDASIVFGIVSLDDLPTVKLFAESYIRSGKPLQVLINNAGVMANPFQKTKQGFESQFGVNHIGHFYLTKLLLPVLARSGTPETKSRVVNVSSLGNYLYPPEEGILWDDLSGDSSYNKWERYGQSKLANILFANQLNKRCAEANQNVISVSLHPGAIAETDLGRHNSLLGLLWENVVYNWRSPAKIGYLFTSKLKTAGQGAATTVLCSIDPDTKAGKWYFDCNETLEHLHPRANDATAASRLWDVSEDLIKPYL